MNKKDYEILSKYFKVSGKLQQELDKAEQTELFVDNLKKWVLKDCTIWQDVKMYVGYLKFSFDNNKTQFVLALPFEVSLLLQQYLDPAEETEDEKDIQKKI